MLNSSLFTLLILIHQDMANHFQTVFQLNLHKSAAKQSKNWEDKVGVGGLELSGAPAARINATAAELAVVLLGGEEAEDLSEDVGEGILEIAVGHDVD